MPKARVEHCKEKQKQSKRVSPHAMLGPHTNRYLHRSDGGDAFQEKACFWFQKYALSGVGTSVPSTPTTDDERGGDTKRCYAYSYPAFLKQILLSESLCCIGMVNTDVSFALVPMDWCCLLLAYMVWIASATPSRCFSLMPLLPQT